MTDADYADDIALLANKPLLVESLLHCQEKATGGIDHYVNADKTEYMCIYQNQTGDISTRTASSFKLVDK